MIDWSLIVASAIWIVGLSIVLAAVGYGDWAVKTTARSWRDMFKIPIWRAALAAGVLLTCTGAIWSLESRWQKGLCAVLATAAGRELMLALRLARERRIYPGTRPPPKPGGSAGER